MDWDLVEAGALAPLGDNCQLAFLRDAAHEEEDVDVPASKRSTPSERDQKETSSQAWKLR